MLREEGVHDPAALLLTSEYPRMGDLAAEVEDRLGCTIADHRHWMRTARAAEVRTWAREWAQVTS